MLDLRGQPLGSHHKNRGCVPISDDSKSSAYCGKLMLYSIPGGMTSFVYTYQSYCNLRESNFLQDSIGRPKCDCAFDESTRLYPLAVCTKKSVKIFLPIVQETHLHSITVFGFMEPLREMVRHQGGGVPIFPVHTSSHAASAMDPTRMVPPLLLQPL